MNFKDLKKILNEERKNEIDLYLKVKAAKIKDTKEIEYILSKYGMGLQCFDDKIKGNRKLVLKALKQNGQAIAFVSPEYQRDDEIIKLSKKIGRTDKWNGKKTKYYLPDITYWYLKFKSKKGKNKKTEIVDKLKLNSSSKNKVSYYSGETVNGVPFGKGVSETYETSALISKVTNMVGKKWSDKYNKKFLKKLNNYDLLERYEGEWEWGVWHGKGEFTDYYDPNDFVNKDGGPKVMEKYKGNFNYGNKIGKFEVYIDSGEDDENKWEWFLKTFK